MYWFESYAKHLRFSESTFTRRLRHREGHDESVCKRGTEQQNHDGKLGGFPDGLFTDPSLRNLVVVKFFLGGILGFYQTKHDKIGLGLIFFA